MRKVTNLGALLAATAMLTSVSADAATRSAASLPQAKIIYPTMPDDAKIINDDTFDYCFEGDMFSKAGVLLEENFEGCAKAATYAPRSAARPAGGTGGIAAAVLGGVAALVAIATSLSGGKARADSPG